MRVLDLFSGIGGFSLGLNRAGMETVAFCEVDTYCQRVLKKHWPDVPCFPDIKQLTKESLDAAGIGAIDLICGGYPCQGESVAGNRKGKADDRWLWPEMLRVICAVKPRWVISENVFGHISTGGADEVISQMEGAGYTCWPFVIPASAVGAPHRRDRIFIISYAKHHGCPTMPVRGSNDQDVPDPAQGQDSPQQSEGVHQPCDVANCMQEQQQGCRSWQQGRLNQFTDSSRWAVEPGLVRVVDGFPDRVDRVEGLGNAVVPDIITGLGLAVIEYEAHAAQ